jgi:hypothetical protein
MATEKLAEGIRKFGQDVAQLEKDLRARFWTAEVSLLQVLRVVTSRWLIKAHSVKCGIQQQWPLNVSLKECGDVTNCKDRKLNECLWIKFSDQIHSIPVLLVCRSSTTVCSSHKKARSWLKLHPANEQGARLSTISKRRVIPFFWPVRLSVFMCPACHSHCLYLCLIICII